jgi:hypothetical protein
VDGGRVVHAENVDRLDLKVGRLELARSAGDADTPFDSSSKQLRTCLMTQPRGRDASAPGKTYLFMLRCQRLPREQGPGALHSQQTPVEVLELPVGPDTRDLEDEQAVVVEQVVHLAEELSVAADTDVLGHLEAGDLVEVTLLLGDVAVVHAEDPALRLGHTVGAQSLVTEFGLVLRESDWQTKAVSKQARYRASCTR